MTTILYDHKARQIAVDGRTTCGGQILCESSEKWLKDGDDYWFICGSVCDQERLMSQIKAADSADAPKWKIEASAFLVSGGKVYQCVVCDDGEPAKSLCQYSDSMGSGGVYALAALDHGKSAKQAVKYAMTRDTGTGGKVSVFDIDRMEFVK